MEKQNLLEIRNLKKYFSTPRGELHAVDNVSFDIEKGKTIGVVGESGCGKSTLGKTLMRLHDPTSGEVRYKGEDIASMPLSVFKKKYRADIQMIFQDPYASLDPRMNVIQLIEEPVRVNSKDLGKEEIRKKAREMMELVGLAKRLENSYPHELDGGRRQRIGIARALSLNPEFIVCDEPVSALDVSIQAQILNLLQDLQRERGLTYLFITHDMSVVRHISDDIAVMYLGQLIEKCPAGEIFKNTIHPYSRALTRRNAAALRPAARMRPISVWKRSPRFGRCGRDILSPATAPKNFFRNSDKTCAGREQKSNVLFCSFPSFCLI